MDINSLGWLKLFDSTILRSYRLDISYFYL